RDHEERVGPPGSVARVSGAPLGRAGRRHMGDPRRAPALRALEGDGLGGVRPRGPVDRDTGARGPARPVARAAGHDPPRRVRARLRPRARLLRAVIWLEGARREPSPDAARRLHAGRRSAHARDDRGDRARPRARRLRPPLPHARERRRRPSARRGRLPSVLVLARRLPRAPRPARRGPCALRASDRPRKRRRPAVGGVRPEWEAPARQLPAGVHASRARELVVQRVAAPSLADASASRSSRERSRVRATSASAPRSAWICSSERFFVSGTTVRKKTTAHNPKNAYSQNAPCLVIESVSVRNVYEIAKLNPQLAIVQTAIAGPRICSGKISAIISQKTGPRPTAKPMM